MGSNRSRRAVVKCEIVHAVFRNAPILSYGGHLVRATYIHDVLVIIFLPQRVTLTRVSSQWEKQGIEMGPILAKFTPFPKTRRVLGVYATAIKLTFK